MNTYKLQKIFSEDRFAMIYMADFTDELTELILGIQQIRSDDTQQMRKRISFLATESFQNVIRHSIDFPDYPLENSPHFFLTRSVQQNHFIVTKNTVNEQAKLKIQSKIDLIKSFNKTELKAYYLNILNNQKISKKGGAGLGLVEMARKSKQPINYLFHPKKQLYDFFLQIKVHGSNLENSIDIPLENAQSIYNYCNKYGLIFLLKGDFSPSSIENAYSMLKGNIEVGNQLIQPNGYVYNLMVDMIALISATAVKEDDIKSGLILMAKTEWGLQIDVSNSIKPEALENLRKLFAKASTLNLKELRTYYKTVDEKKKKLCSLDLLSFFTFQQSPLSFYTRQEENSPHKHFTLSMQIYL